MKLKDLFRDIDVLDFHADPELDVTGISYDSRTTAPGELFAAIPGLSADGHRFIPTAAARGAAAVLCERAPEGELPYVRVASARQAIALASANWFGRPAEKMTMIGITGTNGKTTSTYLLKHILEQTLGAKVGLVGTIQNLIGDEALPTERTTPESYELQGLFAQMAAAGCTHAVMEVSSHALTLDRVAGVHFAVGLFTNLTEDHLDFHKDMEDYCDAKAKLFRMCDTGCVNADDPWTPRLVQNAACRLMTYSARADADLVAQNIALHSDGVSFEARSHGERAQIHLNIPGSFTVYNALGVIQTAQALGLPLPQIAEALSTAQGVKGRAEVVPTPGKAYTVLIDYSHTPDSLENILKTVRGFCRGKIFAVFGCGGDRDPFKRPVMGEIASRLADVAIVTSDNPRTEDPNEIIRQIVAGMGAAQTPPTVIENRPKAIEWAMDHAQPGDVIVLCGKGHETYQEIGHEKIHLDEREVVAAYLERMP